MSSESTRSGPFILRALGGADEVGASCYLYELGNCRVLVDAGMSPKGAGEESLPDLGALTDSPPDAIVLTHAHLDHVGALPLLRRAFPSVPIYATSPTARIAELVMADAAKVARDQDAPLYDEEEAAETARAISVMAVRERQKLPQGVSVIPVEAGHIPGAVSLLLEDADERKVFHTGDLSNAKTLTVEAAYRPSSPTPVDAVVSESTYGDVMLPSRKEQVRLLAETIGDVVQSGGRVLIPTFALGRAQEILLILLSHQRSGVLPEFPIYLDGLVRPMTRLYDELLEAGDMMPRALINMVKNARRSPFYGEGDVRPVKSPGDRQRVIAEGEPAVILASSGMLHAGPSVAYARQILTEERSALLTVGYQDEESPGRMLRELSPGDKLSLPHSPYGGLVEVPVSCRVGRYHLSAHADRAGLLNVLSDYPSDRVVLVHGEGGARVALYESLHKDREVVQAKNGSVVDLASAPRFGKAVRASGSQRDANSDYSPKESDKSLQTQTNDSPPPTARGPRKVSRFNTHADVWVEDGLVLMKLPDDVDVEHLFPEGRYRMKIRRTSGANQNSLRAEIYPDHGVAEADDGA